MADKKWRLYEYAILHHPKAKKDEEAAKSTLVLGPKNILETSEQNVLLAIGQDIPEGLKDRKDELEIRIRPF